MNVSLGSPSTRRFPWKKPGHPVVSIMGFHCPECILRSTAGEEDDRVKEDEEHDRVKEDEVNTMGLDDADISY